MMMKLFSCTKTMNLEEYRAKRSRRTMLYAGMAVLGVVTLLFDFLAVPNMVSPDTQAGGFSRGLYLGAGFALIVCGIFMAVMNARSMKDETKLKRLRAEEEDERSHAIATQATRAAALLTGVVLYLVMLVAGVLSPMLVLFCAAVVCLFFGSMCAFQAYYYHKM